MILAALALALGAVFGFAAGVRITARRAAARHTRESMVAFCRGIQAGADGMANEWLAAAARADDVFDVWPDDRREERRQ
jgi:hypothetical protein